MEGNEIYVLNIVKLIEFVDMLVICCNNFFNGISEYCIEGCVKVMVVCYFGNGVGYIWYVDNLDGDGWCFIVIYYFN